MRPLYPVLILVLLAAAAYAGADRSPGSLPDEPGSWQTKGASTLPSPAPEVATDPTEPNSSASAPLYHLNWWSVNGGGETSVLGTNVRMGASVGQAAAGFVSGTNFKLGVGYWYGAAGGACPIILSGDGNNSGTITSADIIVLVNFVFKGGAAPLPCAANGDVNCSGTVTSSDIIVLVNFVFKGGAAPCNICTIIPSMWTCP